MKTHPPILFALRFVFLVLPFAAPAQMINVSTPGVDNVAQWVVTDPYYPKYHVAPPYGWMNDPHPAFFNGAYHLFYQFSFVRDNPYGRIGLPPGKRAKRTWGHAMSTDLVHWRHMPIALESSRHGRPGDPHIFSGVVVDNKGVGTVFYTINNIDIWMATSKDKDLATFTSCPNNPVIKGPHPGLSISGNMRDPWVWKEGNTWYMIIGSGLADGKGPVIPLYKSADLVKWEYMHPFYRADSSAFDFLGDAPFCECPAFFPLGNKYVLVLSDKTTYFVGRYENHRFIPENRGRLDYGESPMITDGGIYVPEFLLDNKGRRIMFGWAGGWGKVNAEMQAAIDAGWSGMQTVPRVLSLNSDGLIDFEPAEELRSLRSDHKEISDVAISNDTATEIEGVKGMQLEIKAVIKPGTAKKFGIEFLGVSEPYRIYYDVATKSLCFNQVCAPLKLGRLENLEISLFIDGKVVEIYANKKIVMTQFLKPLDPSGYQVKLFAHNGRARVVKADCWKMGTIW
jgi:beta-fructofuranosidase